MRKLTDNEMHLLRLVRRGQNDNGWAKVSKAVFPLVNTLPRRLVEVQSDDKTAMVKLTAEGNSLLDALEWL